MATLAAVLSTVATQVLTVSESVVSEAAYDELRAAGRSPRHKEFAVGLVGTSVPLQALGRQRPSSGDPARHRLAIGTHYQFKSKDRASGYRDAVAWGESIRAVLVAGRTWRGDAQLAWTGTTRQPGPDGWLYLDITFDLTHTDPLT